MYNGCLLWGLGAKRGKTTNFYGLSTLRIGKIVRLGGNVCDMNETVGYRWARSGGGGEGSRGGEGGRRGRKGRGRREGGGGATTQE